LVYFAILSVFALAGAELSQKISLTHKANISAVTNNFFVWIMQGIGGIVIALALQQLTINVLEIPWGRLLLIGLVYFAGGILFYTSYKANSPSVSIILGSISVVISTVLGIVFFNESTALIKFIGILLVISSIVFLNFQKKFSIDKYNLYALMGGVFFGTAFTIDKSFIIQIPPAVYLFLMCFSVAAVSLIAKTKLILVEIKKMNHENYLRIFSSGFFGTLFNFFTFKSYSLGGNVGVVDALNNTAVFFVILLEIFLLKDKKSLSKKILASVVAVGGVLLLSFVT